MIGSDAGRGVMDKTAAGPCKTRGQRAMKVTLPTGFYTAPQIERVAAYPQPAQLLLLSLYSKKIISFSLASERLSSKA